MTQISKNCREYSKLTWIQTLPQMCHYFWLSLNILLKNILLVPTFSLLLKSQIKGFFL